MNIGNVLSLFDGMSCGQIALNRCGIQYDNYYASEIDKHAIKVTQHNFPNTIQLGDIRNVHFTNIGIEVDLTPGHVRFIEHDIDLLLGGSPCQSFSFAGKRKGMSTKDEIEILTLEHYLELKSQNYEFEGQSYLFWEYMRILTEIRQKNPNVKFLLENVVMGEKWERVLSKAIGVNPIKINSALVSAQNRERLYWTNIGLKESGLFGDLSTTITQPKDKGILLKDILQGDVPEKYYLKESQLNWLQSKGGQKSIEKKYTVIDPDPEGICLTARYPASWNGSYISTQCAAMRGRNIVDGKRADIKGAQTQQQLEFNEEGKTNCLTSVQKDNLVVERKVIQLNESEEFGGQPRTQNRIYSTDGISPSLCVGNGGNSSSPKIRQIVLGKSPDFQREHTEEKSYCIDTQNKLAVEIKERIRRLTPLECERLQTVDDFYTDVVSDTQRYRMLGNGWTIDVICHILNYLK